MPQEIRLWAVKGKTLEKVEGSQVRLEKRLEDWLESDISVLDQNLLVIGRQVPTSHGGYIDLLCIDSDGALVAVELKQRRTSREVVAQVLDYASWVKELKADDVEEIAESYSKIDGTLEDALQGKFRSIPSALYENHRSLIVAEDINAGTERIVRYLSELGVPINVATVQVFKDASGQEMLAQVFLVEPEVARDRAPRMKRIEALADASGLGDLYRRLLQNVRKVMTMQPTPYGNSMFFGWRLDKGVSTALVVNAAEPDNRGLAFEIHGTRCCNHLNIPLESLRAMLPANVQEYDGVRKWSGRTPEERETAEGFKGAFHTPEEIDTFVARLGEAARRRTEA